MLRKIHRWKAPLRSFKGIGAAVKYDNGREKIHELHHGTPNYGRVPYTERQQAILDGKLDIYDDSVRLVEIAMLRRKAFERGDMELYGEICDIYQMVEHRKARKPTYGRTVYTERQQAIINGEVDIFDDSVQLREIAVLRRKALERGDMELYGEICDIYQMAKHRNEYKPPYTAEEARAILRSLSGHPLDPDDTSEG